MSTLTFAIIGFPGNKLVTVQANIDGHPINFTNVNKEIYLKRSKTYQAPSKRKRLLSWLHKNGDYTKAPKPVKQTPIPQKVRPTTKPKAAPKSPPVVISQGDMVLEVERQLVAKGYTLVKKGNSIPMTICTCVFGNGNGKTIERGCGKKSMIGAYKETPELKFIGVCYNRYNIGSSCEVVKVWGKKEARVWLAKQKAA